MTRLAPMVSVVLVASALMVTPACSSSSSPGALVADGGVDAGDGRACTAAEIEHADGSCGPADWAVACAAGFAPDPSGFGCRDVLPDAPCTGATRGALGRTACVPVGDCNAAFPPANATLFVAAAGPSDASHFTTIGAALAAASAGAVIAIDSGTYAENVDVTKPVSLVGKCAAEVVIDGAKTTGARGIYVDGTTGVAVSGVTITRQTLGVSLAPNSAVDLKHVVLDGNADVGLALQQGSAKATVEDVVIRGTKAGGEPGFGINLQSGSELTMSDSELVGNQSTAVRVSTSSKATITKSVIRDTTPSALEAYGRGLVVQSGGTADVSTTAFIGNEETAIVLNACTVRLSQVVVRDTLATPNGDFGRAIDAFDGGNFAADSCSFTSNRDVGIIVVNASATISKSVVQATMPDGEGAFGRGITLQEAAKLVLSGTAIVGGSDAGIVAFSEGTTADISGTLVYGVALADEIGFGLIGIDGPIVHVIGSEFAKCDGVGVGFGGSRASIASSVIAHNVVGLATSDDTTLQEVQSTPDSIGGDTVVVTSDTAFVGNQTRVTAGTLPVPSQSKNPSK